MKKFEVNDQMFQNLKQEEIIPSQLLIGVSQNGFYTIGIKDENVQMVFTQFQFIDPEYINSEPKITFSTTPNKIIVAKEWVEQNQNELKAEQSKRIVLYNKDKNISIQDLLIKQFQSLSDISIIKNEHDKKDIKFDIIYDLTSELDDEIKDIQIMQHQQYKNIMIILTTKTIYRFKIETSTLIKIDSRPLTTNLETITLEYKLNQQKEEYVQEQNVDINEQSQSDDDFDIYEFSQISDKSDQSLLSQSEENLTNDSICQLESDQDDIYDYDYFVKYSQIIYKNQHIQLLKILKDNQQMTQTFSKLYELALQNYKKSETEDQQQEYQYLNLSNYVQYFGQQPQFIDDNRFILQINQLDDPILYSFQNNLQTEQIELVMNNNGQNIHFSKNILKVIDTPECYSYLIASRGDKLFIYQKNLN